MALFVGRVAHEKNIEFLIDAVATARGSAPDILLLVTGDNKSELAAPDGKWTRVWEGNRPGDRKEKFRLFQR